MLSQYLLSLALLGTSLGLLVDSPLQAEPPPPTPESPAESPVEYPFDLAKVVSQSAASLAPTLIGGEIDIAVTSAYEKDPAVALCASDQYLVVYMISGDVYGQRLTSGGDLLGSPFVIFDGTSYAAEPDVACEWSRNRFIVVWTIDYLNQGRDYEIHAQGVYGGYQSSGSQLHGYIRNISTLLVDARDPAIACNSNGLTCLVVFEDGGTGSGDIYGQRISIDLVDISLDGDVFNIGGFSAEEYNPDVSWGGYDDNYMVVWQYFHNVPNDHYRIVYAQVYDTEQGANDADEIEKATTWLTNPPGSGLENDQTVPAVAYNRDRREYLVVYNYDFGGGDWDIHALRFTGKGAPVSNLFAVASSLDSESSPAVAFSGGPESFPGGMGANQYLVTYIRDEGANGTVLYGVAVDGDATTVDQIGDREEIARMPNVFMWNFNNPDVTGSINNGRYLIVWGKHVAGINPDDDILGRIVSPYKTIYLPLILRDSP